jgi:2-polyprenyl-3-methyl-5-hydroxy-6-metoxy-1,4-benzoquinol methylase
MSRQKRQIRAIQALKILSLAGHVVDGKLLDLGCGQGWLTEKFAATGVFAVGVDKNLQLIRYAKRDNNRCEFVMADGSYLPFRDSVFKTIVLNDVLEHVPYSDAMGLMKESVCTMSNDGRIYISVMNRWQIFEPHLMVPFMTWLPQQMWDVVDKLRTRKFVGTKYTQHYFPYTKARLKRLTQQLQLVSTDFTWVYGSEKICKPEQIGSSILRNLVNLLKALKFDWLMIKLAERVSPIIFVCKRVD